MTTEELRESLLMAPKNGFARITPEQRAEMETYCKNYMAFMNACKTEREATAWAVAEAEKPVSCSPAALTVPTKIPMTMRMIKIIARAL